MLRRLLLLACSLFTLTAFAADSGALRWRSIGPFRGGRVLAVTGVPGEPEHFYFGSVNGGVWETRDAGRTWQPIFDDQPIGSIGAIAVAPSNPKVIYVGSGEADMRSDIAQGNGMYRSVDGGRSWSHIGLEDSQQIGRVIVHPSNADVAYVAALGHPYGPNAQRGVFRTTDGGKSWQRLLGGTDNATGAVDLAFEPGNPNVIYAALWQTRRTPWSVYPPSNGPGSGLFKTTDGGEHWTQIRGNGFPETVARVGIAVAPSNPRRVYTVVDGEHGGMYRSDDAGATWVKTTEDARVWSRGWYFGGVTVEPDNADVVYSVNINLYRSADGGKTFEIVKGAPGGDDYHQLWIDPQSPNRRILGVDQGTVVSVNGGRTWSSWYNQPTGQFYHVVTDNSFPYRVYGAQQDSGAAGVSSRTNTYQGINILEFREVTAGGESDNIAPDPTDPDVIYGGRVERLDVRTHQTQSIDPTLAYPGEIYRRTWTLPLVFSPRNPRVLYFANQKLFRTEDEGRHWSVISPDLTRENPPNPPNIGAPETALRTGPRPGVIYTIAPSRTADGDIWVGTDDGQVWRTRDEGAHWTNVTPAALTAWSKVGIIEASHFDADTAYVAVDRHRLDDFAPYVYRTHDGGKTWALAANGLQSFVNAVREDTKRKGLLYAATERGMAVSYDDGDHWQSLQLNLPVTSVRDIDVHGDDVVIATHGRGFWIMDDVEPLRQREVKAGLLQPATAVRMRPAGFTGTPMPKDEALASNPPSGAYIDYVVPAQAAQPVALEIFDGHDALVRRYSSADQPATIPNEKMRTAPEWLTTPSTLSAEAGTHRFVWPIRYAAPAPLGQSAYSDGVWAPPGTYKLVLTIDGQKTTQPLTVVGDPRIKLAQSAYDEQSALAREVESARASVAAALEEAHGELEKLKPEDARYARVTELSGFDPATADAWWMLPRSTSNLTYLDGELGKLLDVVDSADAAPSTDARAAWAKLRPLVETALKVWKER